MFCQNLKKMFKYLKNENDLTYRDAFIGSVIH